MVRMHMDIRTRTIPERKLAVIAKELFQPELERFVMTAFTTLFDYAAARPGLRPIATTEEWPTYVIFHGPVTPDLSARVEVCIVIEGDAQPEGDVVIRMEAGHEEAYVCLTRTGIDFPQILDAYSAVAHFAQTHGTMLESMPSREVYIADVLAAGPDDYVCDVAFPYVPTGGASRN